MTNDLVLYEAILWERGSGCFLLDRHLRRLQRSAGHFQFNLDIDLVSRRLEEFTLTLTGAAHKIRLEAGADGKIKLDVEKVKPGTPVLTAVAAAPVDSTDPFLYHKTSQRVVYELALAAHPDAQDVLLWNERGELTETCHANVVLDIEGRKLTPHHSCGLLPGTFREDLLERHEIEEAILPLDAIGQADGLYLINSIRRWCDINLLHSSIHTDGAAKNNKP